MKNAEPKLDPASDLILAGQTMALQVLRAEMQALSQVIPGIVQWPPTVHAETDDSAFDNFPV